MSVFGANYGSKVIPPGQPIIAFSGIDGPINTILKSYPRSGRSANTRITMVKIRVIATMVRIGRGLMELVILNNILSETYIP